VNFRGSAPPISLPAFTPLAWGTTAAQIQANFAANILYGFETNLNLDNALTMASDVMLARLSAELAAHDTAGDTHWILAYAIVRGVSVANLKRLHAAFGDTLMAGVLSYMTPAVLAAYNSPSPTVTPMQFSQNAVIHGLPGLPAYSQIYTYDLYLDQYFSTTDTPTMALRKAVVYLQVRVKLTVVDVIIITGAVASIISLIDPNAVEDLRNWWEWQMVDPRNFPYVMQIIIVPDPRTNPDWPPLPDPSMPDFPPLPDPGPDCYAPQTIDFCG
jgi:hypothetical protein